MPDEIQTNGSADLTVDPDAFQHSPEVNDKADFQPVDTHDLGEITSADLISQMKQARTSGFRQKEVVAERPQGAKRDQAPETPIKPEDKVEELVVPTTTRAQQPAQPRDFTGLTPEEVAIFKKMGNEQFNFLHPKYLAAKKLEEEHAKLRADFEAASGKHLYEEENAFQLHPDYQQVTKHVEDLSFEEYHWQQQLENVIAGNPWFPLIKREDGNYVYGQPQAPSPKAEVDMQTRMNKAVQFKAMAEGRRQEFQKSFKTQHDSYSNDMKGLLAEITKGVDMKKLEPDVDKFVKRFPPHMRGRPDVKVAATVFAINQQFVAEKAAATSQQNTDVTKRRLAANGSPSSTAVGSGPNPTSTVKDEIDRLNKLKAQMMT